MKICFFGDSGSIHIQRWCYHFATLGHEVHLITFNNQLLPDVKVYPVFESTVKVQGGNWKVLLKFRKIKKIVRSIAPDVFHSFYATSYGVTGALAGFHPYIVTTLGSDILISPQNSKVYQRLLKFAFKRADLITAMSDQMNEEIVKLGADENKVVTLPFGIDPLIFNDNQRELPRDHFVVTHTRNFEDIYNIPHFLKALALVKDKIPNLHINMLGAGSKEQDIKSLVHELALEEIVQFHGKMKQTDMAQLLQKSHVFVSVSLSDGNNISLNEAMACGAYPVVTDIVANRQWIDNGENGKLVMINDVEGLASALLDSYQNYDKLNTLAKPISRDKIEEKGLWPNNMNKMLSLYEQLLQK